MIYRRQQERGNAPKPKSIPAEVEVQSSVEEVESRLRSLFALGFGLTLPSGSLNYWGAF